ncbi:MAG: hypothetical protein KBD01_13795 [Acidobacteria bacterium]|nr:hypothetical protein [Acidobacteriota bacterium]
MLWPRTRIRNLIDGHRARAPREVCEAFHQLVEFAPPESSEFIGELELVRRAPRKCRKAIKLYQRRGIDIIDITSRRWKLVSVRIPSGKHRGELLWAAHSIGGYAPRGVCWTDKHASGLIRPLPALDDQNKSEGPKPLLPDPGDWVTMCVFGGRRDFEQPRFRSVDCPRT